ncbi:hypothetical protein E2C01_048053 [Portunus trituberculatus]|uniref:Uncharacterized protein n=1 Tax=Portunus trituberculatus TaxID=210409 RepID=A0A5B7G9I4_PORTR|nr:hypothetical protein [Portunus trituberculatus]
MVHWEPIGLACWCPVAATNQIKDQRYSPRFLFVVDAFTTKLLWAIVGGSFVFFAHCSRVAELDSRGSFLKCGCSLQVCALGSQLAGCQVR